MAKMNVQGYRDSVRTVMDLTADDLSDTLIDLFLTQGMRYAQRWNQGLWPAYTNTWTVTLTAAQRDYTYAELEVNDASGYQIAQIRDIRSDDRLSFVYLSRSDFDRQIPRATTQSQSPYIWSPRDNDTIRFFPTPDDAYEIDIQGWRHGRDWVSDGTGGESDLPEAFDDAILAYTLGKIYASQDEGQTSVFWLQMADVHLNQLEDQYDQGPPIDMAMNGKSQHLWRSETPGRIPFNFEI